MSIETKYNFDDVFFRDLAIAVKKNLDNKVKWINKFEDKNVDVNVPFYYSMSGDDRFLMDLFNDDIAGSRLELNTDIIPRGHFYETGFGIKSDEFANPNVWLRMSVEDNITGELKSIITKLRAVPISVTYDINILLDNEIDGFKCRQSILNALWLYKYMNFEYNFMKIDAVMIIPDDIPIEVKRNIDLSSNESRITMKFSVQVHTYYPAFVDSQRAQGVYWTGDLH